VTGSDTLNKRTTVTFTTRNHAFKFKAYIYETTHDILLGNDFLRKFTPKIDYFQKKIVFENATIPFNLSKEEMKGRTLKRQITADLTAIDVAALMAEKDRSINEIKIP